MSPNLMNAVGAFSTGLGGVYIGRHIEGDLSVFAVGAFGIGIVWLSQAPIVAMRKRVRELESALGSTSPGDQA